MELKAGQKLYSAVSDAQFVVVRAPAGAIEIACGGVPVLTEAPTETVAGEPGEGVLVGKRYVDEADTVELLCAKPGSGDLTFDGGPAALKGAKPLPASD